MEACTIAEPVVTSGPLACTLPTNQLSNYAGMFVNNNLNLAVLVISLLLAIALLVFFHVGRIPLRGKVLLIYAHIAALIFPFVFILFNVGCEKRIYQCNLQTVAFGIPFLLIGIAIVATLLGFLALPLLFERRGMCIDAHPAARIVRRLAAREGWRVPRIYAFDDGGLRAFSIAHLRPAIFISIGMLETFTRKEIEAVLLHELWHTRSGSSELKVVASIARVLSPLAAFGRVELPLEREERDADACAARFQGTSRHVHSARRKVSLN